MLYGVVLIINVKLRKLVSCAEQKIMTPNCLRGDALNKSCVIFSCSKDMRSPFIVIVFLMQDTFMMPSLRNLLI